MSGYIQGNYTQAQVQDLTRIWENLPTADQKTLNADTNELQNLIKQFPSNSTQAQNLLNIYAAVTSIGIAGDPQAAEQQIALQLYPQLPNILNSYDQGNLQGVLKDLKSSNPAVEEDWMTLGGIMMEMQDTNPQTLQTMAIAAQMTQARTELMQYLNDPQPHFLSNVADIIHFVLPSMEGTQGPSSAR